MATASVLAALVSGLSALPPATAAGCTLAPTSGTVTRTVAGRTYELFVPAGLSGTSVPLLVSLHGFGSNGTQHADQTGWSQHASAHGFIVAFPNGNFRSWNFQQGSPDIAWLRAVVADISAGWCVDGARVHASGHSNGAYMAQRLACDASDLFASVTEYAGGSPDTFTPCALARPVAVGLFHGDADFVVVPQQGVGARDGWVRRDQCATTPANDPVAEGVLLRYSGCAGGVEVIWRTYPGQGHLWPTGARQQDILGRMWSFLLSHPKP